ncbi:MAG: hypothetical protein CML66_10145 [Rhodobacteraceae bacterium]|nr:hypothetical protein [Paracoccaceae bacterium]MAY43971.1 hypothetical protein [Paracoccaceae bacterium]
MKSLAVALMCLIAQPALAEWYFVSNLEGGAEYWTFTNPTGKLTPVGTQTEEIRITRNPMVRDLGPDGVCTHDNCTISVVVDGKMPKAGDPVTVRFSTTVLMNLTAASDDALLVNATPVGEVNTNAFIRNIRDGAWVDISYAGQTHRFDLSGSSKAWGAYRHYSDTDAFKSYGG